MPPHRVTTQGYLPAQFSLGAHTRRLPTEDQCARFFTIVIALRVSVALRSDAAIRVLWRLPWDYSRHPIY